MCFFHEKYGHLTANLKSPIPLICLFGAGVFVSFAGNSYRAYAIFAPFVFAISVLFAASVKKDSAVSKVLQSQPLQLLGRLSFGIYMIHMFVWSIISDVFRFLLRFPTAITDGESVPIFPSPYFADLVLIGGLFVTIILASISFKYIETRFYGEKGQKQG